MMIIWQIVEQPGDVLLSNSCGNVKEYNFNKI